MWLINNDNTFSFLLNGCLIEDLPFPMEEDHSWKEDPTPSEGNDSILNDKDSKIFSNKGLHFVHINSRSLLANLDQIIHFALNCNHRL